MKKLNDLETWYFAIIETAKLLKSQSQEGWPLHKTPYLNEDNLPNENGKKILEEIKNIIKILENIK